MKKILFTTLLTLSVFSVEVRAAESHPIRVDIWLHGATLADTGRIFEENLLDQAKTLCGSWAQVKSLQNVEIQMKLGGTHGELEEDKAPGETLLFLNYPHLQGSGEVVCK